LPPFLQLPQTEDQESVGRRKEEAPSIPAIFMTGKIKRHPVQSVTLSVEVEKSPFIETFLWRLLARPVPSFFVSEN